MLERIQKRQHGGSVIRRQFFEPDADSLGFLAVPQYGFFGR